MDVIPEKVEKLNNRISPIQDDYIEKYLAEKPLNLVATLDGKSAYADADFVVIAAPTNYDPVKNYFDTTHVEEVIDLVLEVNPDAVMVIKSTIPVGYTRNLYLKYAQRGVRKFNLLFSPEFLRESKALYDNLYPSRIIVGYPKIINKPEFEAENKAIESVTDVDMLIEAAKTFAALLVVELLPYILIDNAIKYSHPKHDIVIKFEETDQVLTVCITSCSLRPLNGDVSKLMDRGYRDPNAAYLKDGKGIGLYLANTICKYNDIDISISLGQNRETKDGYIYSDFNVKLVFRNIIKQYANINY